MKRLIIGFFLAPLLPILVIGALTVLTRNFDHGVVLETIWGIGFIVAFTYPIAAILGLPILFVALKFGFVRWFDCVIVGIVLGTMVGAFFSIPTAIANSPTLFLGLLKAAPIEVPFIIIGIIVSTTFWFIARPDIYHRSNRPASKSKSSIK